jgi:hypothetical protein
MNMNFAIAVIINYCCPYDNGDVEDDPKYHRHVVTMDELDPVCPKLTALLLL